MLGHHNCIASAERKALDSPYRDGAGRARRPNSELSRLEEVMIARLTAQAEPALTLSKRKQSCSGYNLFS